MAATTSQTKLVQYFRAQGLRAEMRTFDQNQKQEDDENEDDLVNENNFTGSRKDKYTNYCKSNDIRFLVTIKSPYYNYNKNKTAKQTFSHNWKVIISDFYKSDRYQFNLILNAEDQLDESNQSSSQKWKYTKAPRNKTDENDME